MRNTGIRPIYLDCAATTPVDPRVAEIVMRFMVEEFGNSGSRTHGYGTRALQAVQQARDQVAAVVGATREEVIFTSGATESNNLAILGLESEGVRSGRRHMVSTSIEHKAVLEPLEALSRRGFDVTLVDPDADGAVSPANIAAAVRADTLLVSVMHANNETGVIQPLDAIATALADHTAYFHTDAAQGFGKDLAPLTNSRIDLISISGHKVFAPKGVGALIARRRRYERIPLSPLMHGGGQERGLRPGTLPVPLIAGLGLAAELAAEENSARAAACLRIRSQLLDALSGLPMSINGSAGRRLPNILSFSVAGLDSEAVLLATRHLFALSNGAACATSTYQPSHVLRAMGIPPDAASATIRASWSHMTPEADFLSFHRALRQLF